MLDYELNCIKCDEGMPTDTPIRGIEVIVATVPLHNVLESEFQMSRCYRSCRITLVNFL
jgi:hypothetical protein